MTAYHESGHALLAWLLPDVDPVHKVTIIPRGRALGVTQLLPDEERFNIGEQPAAFAVGVHARRAGPRKSWSSTSSPPAPKTT